VATRHGKRPKNFRKFTKYVTQYHPRNVACNGDATEAARTRQAAKPERRQKKVHACEGPRAGPTGGCGGQQGRLEQVTHEDEFNQSKPTLHPITDDEIFLRIPDNGRLLPPHSATRCPKARSLRSRLQDCGADGSNCGAGRRRCKGIVATPTRQPNRSARIMTISPVFPREHSRHLHYRSSLR